MAETSLGGGVIGVVDGQVPPGVEGPQGERDRHALLRRLGYKL